jgi:hypothetical protein
MGLPFTIAAGPRQRNHSQVLFNGAVNNPGHIASNDQMIMSNEFERMQTEVVVA